VPFDTNCDVFPMTGQVVSLYLPMGHIKSKMMNDGEFVKVEHGLIKKKGWVVDGALAYTTSPLDIIECIKQKLKHRI